MSTAPMRMLYWTREEFPTYRVDIDVLFGRELIGRGHAIDFVMQAASPDIPAGPHPWHGRTVYVGRTAAGSTAARFARHALALWHDLRSLRLAHRDRYQALQVRDKFVIAAIALWVARRRGMKFFFWLSFPYPEADREHARTGETRFPFFANLRGIVSGWLLYRWIVPRADQVFVQSERMKQDFIRQGCSGRHLTPVPMGVDLSDTPLRASGAASHPGAPVVLGYLGALNADRHPGVLIEMLALLRSGGHGVRLLLVGDASEPGDRQRLEQRVHELGLAEAVEITGMLPRPEALLRMQEVDIALSPYYPAPILLSTSPTKLVEYLALGLPVVASEHPEQRLILHASRAGVCAPWGARHFARAARWLLRHSPAQRAEMGMRGRAWVSAHRTYGRIADNLERQYDELMSTGRPL